ncbi:MAG: Dabb family protein [Candidatus Hydrogenedentota bacterium]
MHKVSAVLGVLGLAMAGCASITTNDARPETAATVKTTVSAPDTCCTGPCLRHLVLFKWKDGTPPDKVQEIEEAFAALPEKIPQIRAFEWGTDMSVEDLSQGFTHAFLVSFKSENDRAVYLPHPEHKKFGDLIGPHLDKVLVVDYWAQR